jgi:hypothetical protein
MHNIYLYNNLHYGDIITNRALIKELLKYPQLNIAVGCYANHYYLYEDLFVQHIVSQEDENFPLSIDLVRLCPNGYMPINTHCGTYRDLDIKYQHNWINIVETFNRQSKIYNLGIELYHKEVPMIDFNVLCDIKIIGRGIYIENGVQRSHPTSFEFDIENLCNIFPEFNFYCTSKAPSKNNVIDCSDKNLIELSHISNQCESILGKGSGPMLCTYTEDNRFKPRAVCGYDTQAMRRFWEYRGNPIKYLYAEDEVVEFLIEVRNNKPRTLGPE